MRIIWSVLGYSITIVSAFFICAFAIDFMTDSERESSVLIGLVVFFILTGASGILLIRRGRRSTHEKQERLVLELAESKNGRITPVEIAMETSLTASESQVTENGSVVYAFTGLISESERETAQNPLDR